MSRDRRRRGTLGRLALALASAAVAVPGYAADVVTVSDRDWHTLEEPWGFDGLDGELPRAFDFWAARVEATGEPTRLGTASFDVRRSGDLPSGIGPPLADDHRGVLNVKGSFALGSDSTLTVRSRVVDLQRRLGDGEIHFDASRLDDWERNTLSDTTLKLDLWGDRVQIRSRHAFSDHASSGSASVRDVAAWLRQADDPLLADGETAQATHQRIQVALLRRKSFSLSAFGVHRSVGEDFVWRTAEERRAGKRTPFGAAGRRTMRGGLRVGMGPLDVTLAATSASALVDERDESGALERGFKADVGLALAPLAGGSDTALGRRLAGWSVWASASQARLWPEGDDEGRADATRDLSAGFAFSGSRLQLSVGGWRSFHDGRQAWSEEADWSGRGIDLNAGWYQGDVYVALNYAGGRYENLDPSAPSHERSHDLDAGLTWQHEGLPGLGLGAYWSRYEAVYPAWDGWDVSDTRGLRASLDLSKALARWLPPAIDDAAPRLRASYRFEETRIDASGSDPERVRDHGLVVSVDLRF
jgi:hypothetical protein